MSRASVELKGDVSKSDSPQSNSVKIPRLDIFSLDRSQPHAGLDKQFMADGSLTIKTTAEQGARAVSFFPTTTVLKDGFILIRVAALAVRGTIGIGLLESNDRTKFIREVSISPDDGPSVLEFVVDATASPGPLVIRNTTNNNVASEAVIESIHAYHLIDESRSRPRSAGHAAVNPLHRIYSPKPRKLPLHQAEILKLLMRFWTK